MHSACLDLLFALVLGSCAGVRLLSTSFGLLRILQRLKRSQWVWQCHRQLSYNITDRQTDGAGPLKGLVQKLGTLQLWGRQARPQDNTKENSQGLIL